MGLMTLTACDDYLDINDSPNAISSVENDYILPTPEVNIASTVGVQFNVLGGYNAQVYGQNAGCSNYLDYSRFLVTASNCQGAWTQLYSRVLQQREVIRTQAAAEPGTYLAATVLRAYAFQLIVDAWGEAPFTEALNPSITQPEPSMPASLPNSKLPRLLHNQTMQSAQTFSSARLRQRLAQLPTGSSLPTPCSSSSICASIML